MKYFLHDTNSFSDEKITELFINFGYEGLGLFYTALEKIAFQEKPVKTNVLKSQLKVGKKLEKCWKFMETLGILSSNNGETFNKQLLNFSEKYNIKKEKNKEKILQWRENQRIKENVTSYKPVRNAPKVNKSKVNKSKVNSKEFTPPILNEVIDYFKKNNYTEIAAKKAFDYYEAGNWHDSKGNPVLSWKQKMRGVWFKDENLIKKPNEAPTFNKQQEFAMKIAGPMNTFMGRCEAYKINHPGELPPQEWYDKFNLENGTDLKPK